MDFDSRCAPSRYTFTYSVHIGALFALYVFITTIDSYLECLLFIVYINFHLARLFAINIQWVHYNIGSQLRLTPAHITTAMMPLKHLLMASNVCFCHRWALGRASPACSRSCTQTLFHSSTIHWTIFKFTDVFAILSIQYTPKLYININVVCSVRYDRVSWQHVSPGNRCSLYRC